jgi:hypothetical protein
MFIRGDGAPRHVELLTLRGCWRFVTQGAP